MQMSTHPMLFLQQKHVASFFQYMQQKHVAFQLEQFAIQFLYIKDFGNMSKSQLRFVVAAFSDQLQEQGQNRDWACGAVGHFLVALDHQVMSPRV